MLKTQPVGRGAAARKYDLLTAIGAYALSKSKHEQRLALRFMTLITARYNWGRNELATGQREIARLWSCDERTVKREMAKLRGLGWLQVKRQGVRGRVTEYRMDIDAVLAATQPHWAAIGSDFVIRQQASSVPDEAPQIVPFPGTSNVAPPNVSDGTEWSLARAILHQEDPARFGAWLSSLERVGRAGGRLQLKAPSRFHAAYVQTHLTESINAACQAVDGSVNQIEITA